jgi:hypothetical protein
MKSLARRLVGLYPREWRARYGVELDALLEDANLKWRDIFDLLRSALEVRMNQTALPHIVNLASRDIPHGYELETQVEYPLQDGSKILVRGFHREIDLGDSYLTLHHSSRGAEPAETILIWGRKGEIDGDFRTDETEMLVLRADATVQRTEQTVKTWLKHDAIRDGLREKYRSGMADGLSPDEIHRRILATD